MVEKKKKEEQKIRPEIGSTEGTPASAAGLQTFQIGNKVVSKADFEGFINSEKVTLAAQGTPDLTPGAQPFDKPREAGVQPTAGRTAEQFQQQQAQSQQAGAQQQPTNFPLGAQAPSQPGLQVPFVGRPVGEEIDTQQALRKIAKGENTPELAQFQQQLGLTPMDVEVLKAGDANTGRLALLVEALPGGIGRKKLLGSGISLVTLAELTGSSPAEKVDNIISELGKASDQIDEYTTLLASNPAAAPYYKSQIQAKQRELLRMESRIKLLTIQSPDLRANPEKVTNIETSIFQAKEKARLILLRIP